MTAPSQPRRTMKLRYTELFTYVLFEKNSIIEDEIKHFIEENKMEGSSISSDTIDWYFSDDKGHEVSKEDATENDWLADEFNDTQQHIRVYFSRILITKLSDKTTELKTEYEIDDWTTTNDYIIYDNECEHNNTITNECSDCNEQELFDDMVDYTLYEIKDMLVGGSNNVLSDIIESYQKHGGFQDNELMNKVETEILRRLR